MLGVKYYKDYRHNYLIVKDNGSLSENVYQRKMVTENKISGLLPTSEKHINGELLLYYEITSKQSLQSLFAGQTIKMKHLKKFFVQLKMVNDTLQKYLLDGSCLVLLPEYVFQNVETEEIFFLYYPEPEIGNLSELMDFFMERVDNEDMEAVEAVYKIADLIHREQFVLDEVLKWFEEDLEAKQDLDYERSPAYQGYLNDLDEEWEPAKEKRSDRRIIKLFPAVGISAIGAGILIYIMLFYELSYKESVYLIMGWGMVILILAVSGIWYFKQERIDRKAMEPEEFTDTRQFVQTHVTDEQDRVKDVGNTVFIPWTENCENKLYGTDRRNKCHIDLQRLPLTVGKLAGAVDFVIDEQSISRMHARFTKTGSRIFITDLNSTNGTFRNGMRLEPNASEMIEPGDEIRLGKLKFIYR